MRYNNNKKRNACITIQLVPVQKAAQGELWILVASSEVHSPDYLSHRGLARGIETPQEISRLIVYESVEAGTSAAAQLA